MEPQHLPEIAPITDDPQRRQWNDYYRSRTPNPDPWLDRHILRFRSTDTCVILDLGCGDGTNIPSLCGTGSIVHALDYSAEAITHLPQTPQIHARVADMRDPLPYPDAYFDLIVSDLSLHYFSESETRRIITEVSRILKPEAILVARLNSSNDTEHGAGQGRLIEPGYFDIGGIRKRFFDADAIQQFFSPCFEILEANETSSDKYRARKHLWEIVLKNRHG